MLRHALHSQRSCGFAPHYYEQEELSKALLSGWEDRYFNPQRIVEFQKNVLVGGRHLAMPLGSTKRSKAGDFNQAWIDAAVPMATDTVENYSMTQGSLPLIFPPS